MGAKTRIQFVYIFSRVRKVISEINFTGVRAAYLIDGQLYFVAVAFDTRLYFDDVIAFKNADDILDIIPDARLNRSSPIAQLKAQKGFSLASSAKLFFTDQQECN